MLLNGNLTGLSLCSVLPSRCSRDCYSRCSTNTFLSPTINMDSEPITPRFPHSRTSMLTSPMVSTRRHLLEGRSSCKLTCPMPLPWFHTTSSSRIYSRRVFPNRSSAGLATTSTVVNPKCNSVELTPKPTTYAREFHKERSPLLFYSISISRKCPYQKTL